MKPLAKTHFPLAKTLILLLALPVLAVLVSGCGGKRESEYPYGYTTRVLVDESTGIQNYGISWEPAISADGRYVAFNAPLQFYDGKAAYGITSSVFVYDRKTGETVCASAGSDGKPVDGYHAVISADGRYVAFTSGSDNLASIDTNQYIDIYVRELKTGKMVLASMASNELPANARSLRPSISADGRYVAFESEASNLVKDDTNEVADIFVADLDSGKIRRVSVASDGTEANGPSFSGVISASGRYVTFLSEARNLAAGVEAMGIFLYDLDKDETVFITDEQGIVVAHSTRPAISADGRFVVFSGGHNDSVYMLQDYGLYLYDRKSGKVEFLVKGLGGELPESPAYNPSISKDGRYVAFESSAGNLVAGDTNQQVDIFVLDRKENTIQRVSVSAQNIPGDMNSYDPALSADGQHVAFVSEARNLTAGYPTGAIGVFMHDISKWGDFPSIDARRFGQAEPFADPYPPPTRVPLSYPYPAPPP